MTTTRTTLCFMVTVLFFMLWANSTTAQIVQSGNTIMDLATATRVNPDPVVPGVCETDQELLTNGGFETGSISPWYTNGGWQIVTNNPHTGTYCAYNFDNYWIRQDFTPTPSSQITSVTLWERQPNSAISAIDFIYQGGAFSENVIGLTSTWTQYNVTSFILPGQIVTGIRIYGYSSGPLPWESDIDDISVQTAGGALDLTVTLTPVNPPIIIPQSGGTVGFSGNATNNGTAPATFQAWMSVLLPNGAWLGPLWGPLTITFAAGQSITHQYLQSVPATAPAGQYTYRAWVGTYPAGAVDSSSFTFIKSTTGNGPQRYDWTCLEDPLPGDEISPAAAPGRFTLEGVSPNPFNPTTTFSFTLPEMSRVTLNVYDISGRCVAQLVNGTRDAGQHQVTFDGSNLASGVYLYTLNAGRQNASGKMMLLK